MYSPATAPKTWSDYFLSNRKQPIYIVIITASARRTIAVRGQVGVEPQGKQRISIYLIRLNLKL